jgi:saccharopine dehydrogenase-like NADP-dependent oxidoreductase
MSINPLTFQKKSLKNILIFGAGKSATELIHYIGNNSLKENWGFIVADAQLELAEKKVKPYPNGKALAIDITHAEQRKAAIEGADIVISLLPPSLHIQVARDCIQWKKHLLTASYIDTPLKELEKEINNAGILFLCEMGLDPGIDHMSAMELITRLKEDDCTIHSFISHCGGLIAPESDNNPWHYKISWNPRNIVLAGSAGSVYRENGKTINRKYEEIFKACPSVSLPGLSNYAWYPNRDSLSYIPLYGLNNTNTFIRTTLRHSSFCKGWQILVELGLTDPADCTLISNMTTYRDWMHAKLKAKGERADWTSFKSNFETTLQDQLDMLELDSPQPLPEGIRSSADILQKVLGKKWMLQPDDKDMIVMQHEIEYLDKQDQHKKITSSLIVKGTDQERTAMAKTVGLPLGIAAKLILNGEIKLKGLKIPIEKEIYEPVLKELQLAGITFHETIS